MYKRVLLKISGEQLSGKHEFGIDPAVIRYFAREVQKVLRAGCQLVLVVGGGNVVRGAQLAGKTGIKRVTADQMGMLSGLMNAVAVTDIFESEGVSTRCVTNIFADQVAEPYSFRSAESHLGAGRVLVIAGGIGRPFFTHDTAAVSMALELSCELVLKATKVDGVYDKDPMLHTDAVRFEKLSYPEAVRNDAIKVMDKAALGLAMEQNMPVIVLDALKADNILKATKGEPVGTFIA
ncbi:MAG TPA: uridine monophosphate kinase [Candidatus Saccharimonadales bacterium]|nr:uridine monophosphate kinase [Candidatus Saccharimonadales bacterium]